MMSRATRNHVQWMATGDSGQDSVTVARAVVWARWSGPGNVTTRHRMGVGHPVMGRHTRNGGVRPENVQDMEVGTRGASGRVVLLHAVMGCDPGPEFVTDQLPCSGAGAARVPERNRKSARHLFNALLTEAGRTGPVMVGAEALRVRRAIN